jgi:pilus assembly protein CpaF
VRARFNIVISGEVWAGKTTLLRCLINEIPPLERIITIEDSRELGIEHFPEDMHADVEAIEARKANIEDKAEYTLSQAVRDSLRMGSGPDGRVMVGEVRGYEVLPMLKVMSQGKDGSMCTVHARSSRDALDRLQTYALEATPPYPLVASARLIGNGVHFVVHLKWHTDDRKRARRRVQSILEVSHGEGEQVMANEIWAPDTFGRGVPAAPLRHDTEHRLVDHGFDPTLRDRPEGWWRS